MTSAEARARNPTAGRIADDNAGPRWMVACDAKIIARGAARLLWHAGPPPALTELQHRAVDEVWQRAVAELGDALYDAPILVYRGHETAGDLTTIHGVYQPYRYYYARYHCDRLDYELEPIGVSGLIVFSEGRARAVALGRRSENVTQYPGRWECVPSGGVDDSCARPDGTVDFTAMLLHEFEEEACLPAERARRVVPFAVIYDVLARTYDVCCEMTVTADRDELTGAMSDSDEYTEVMVVTEDELEDCLRRLGDELIPLSRAILELFRDTR